jgi:hypothetical protein
MTMSEIQQHRADAEQAYDVCPTPAHLADRIEGVLEELGALKLVCRGPLGVGGSSYGSESAVRGLLTAVYESRRGLDGAYGAVGGRLREPIDG